MSALRPPVVAGLGRGTGVSTIATALHAVDGGVFATAGADVLVCDLAALRHVPPLRGRPVLAVHCGHRPPSGCGAPTRAVAMRAALDALGPAGTRFGHVTVLPHVPALAAGALPPPVLARLLACDVARLDGPLRALAAALRDVADALVRGGRLTTVAGTTRSPSLVPSAAPPRRVLPPATRRATGLAAQHAAPARARLWPGLGPVERRPAGPDAGGRLDHHGALDDLDDLDIEAAHDWRAAG